MGDPLGWKGLLATINLGSREVSVTLSVAAVQPHLEYCISFWAPHCQQDIDKLEGAQRRAAKTIKDLEGFDVQGKIKRAKSVECG